MPDIRSPLQNHQTPGAFGGSADKEPSLVLSTAPSGAITQLAGWDNFVETVSPGMKELGFADWQDYQRADRAGELWSFRIAPDRLWIIGNASLEVESSADVAMLDLSHSRWRIRLSGEQGRDVLSRLAPIDFSDDVFPIESFAQTGVHHVSVLIHHSNDHDFDIYVPVTWAVSIWEAVCEAALPFGYRVD